MPTHRCLPCVAVLSQPFVFSGCQHLLHHLPISSLISTLGRIFTVTQYSPLGAPKAAVSLIRLCFMAHILSQVFQNLVSNIKSPSLFRREAFLHSQPIRVERNLYQYQAEKESSRVRFHSSGWRRAGRVPADQEPGP